jgi:hypothetical protein
MNEQINLSISRNDIIDMFIEEKVAEMNVTRDSIIEERNTLSKTLGDLHTSELEAARSMTSVKIKKLQTVFPNLVPVFYNLGEYTRGTTPDMVTTFIYMVDESVEEEFRKNMDRMFMSPYKMEAYVNSKHLLHGGPMGMMMMGGMGRGRGDSAESMNSFKESVKFIDSCIEFKFEINNETFSKSKEVKAYYKRKKELDQLNNDISNITEEIRTTRNDRDGFKAKLTKLVLSGTEEGQMFLDKISTFQTQLKLNQ